MIKTLNNTIKQDRTAYKNPRSVQDVIPIQRIFADGIFQFGTKYSRTLRFSDINYAIASKEDKTAMFLGYSELLNALDSGSTTKLTICNKQVNRQAFEDTVLLRSAATQPRRIRGRDSTGMLEGKKSPAAPPAAKERFSRFLQKECRQKRAHSSPQLAKCPPNSRGSILPPTSWTPPSGWMCCAASLDQKKRHCRSTCNLP